jgi:hypothetical protein
MPHPNGVVIAGGGHVPSLRPPAESGPGAGRWGRCDRKAQNSRRAVLVPEQIVVNRA